jgi:hypothetical protein
MPQHTENALAAALILAIMTVVLVAKYRWHLV